MGGSEARSGQGPGQVAATILTNGAVGPARQGAGASIRARDCYGKNPTGDRRLRLHRRQLRPFAARRPARLAGDQPGQAHLCRQPGQPARGGRQPALHLRARRHLRPVAGRGTVRARAHRHGGPFRRRVARGPLHRRPGRLHPHQHPRHLHPARGGAAELAGRRGGCRPPLPAREHGRGVRLARADRPVQRNHPLRSALALLGLQGQLRPPGAGLLPHLRPAGADHQLLEQLRALPVPGEAHPADAQQRPARPAAAGLRRRRQRARLAVRGGPLRGHRARAY